MTTERIISTAPQAEAAALAEHRKNIHILNVVAKERTGPAAGLLATAMTLLSTSATAIITTKVTGAATAKAAAIAVATQPQIAIPIVLFSLAAGYVTKRIIGSQSKFMQHVRTHDLQGMLIRHAEKPRHANSHEKAQGSSLKRILKNNAGYRYLLRQVGRPNHAADLANGKQAKGLSVFMPQRSARVHAGHGRAAAVTANKA